MNASQQRVTTIILLRHAEREPPTPPDFDPPLTAAGRQRAKALIQVAGQAGVVAIYTSQFKRTKQTAEPLAAHLGIAPKVFNHHVPADAQALAQDLLSHHEGEAVVVIGHTDTVPLVIKALGVPSPPSIEDTEFDRLFVVVKHKGGVTRLIQGRYGP